MPMLGQLRPYMGPFKRLLARPYLAAKFSPTQVGLFGVLLAVLAAAAMRLGYQVPAFWLTVAAVLTDMADGEVARRTNTSTPLGNYMDAMLDRVREGILLFGLLRLSPDLVALALLGTFLTSFAKARTGLVVISDNRDWPGFGDHADRAVMLLVAYAFPGYLGWTLVALVTATWTCFIGRVRQARSVIGEAGNEELLPYLRVSDTYQR